MAAATEIDVKTAQCGKTACSKTLSTGTAPCVCAECGVYNCAEHSGGDLKAQIEAWENKLFDAEVDFDKISLLYSALSSSGHNDAKCPECACEGNRARPMRKGAVARLGYYQCTKNSEHFWSPYIGVLRDGDYTRATVRLHIGDDRAYLVYLKGVAKTKVASTKKEMEDLQKRIDLLSESGAETSVLPPRG